MQALPLLVIFFLLAPSNVISRLENKLDSMESAADDNNKGWTTRAKNGLRELRTNWLQTPETRRGEIVTALNTAASKLGKFANAGDDAVGAIRGAVEIIASFASLAGPHGQIISVVLNFISGFLSLFGKGPSPKPLSQVVREEIEKWYSRDLSNQAEGSIFDFQTSRVFLNGVSKAGRNLTESESTALPSYVPVYNGVAFMGTLSSEIRNIIRGNKAGEAKKCLKYIELYTRMAVLKDLVLQQMAALISDSQSSIRDGVYAYQDYIRSSAKALFKFLYESEIGSNIIPYFDPDKYELTDAYMSEVLEIENYDRSMAGKYFVNVRMRSSYGRLGYVSAMPLVNYEDRGADLVFGGNFYWKLVPHGKNLFSIVNRYNCHANDGLCDAMLTWTESHGLYRVTIKHEDPALWEITRTSNSRRRRYR